MAEPREMPRHSLPLEPVSPALFFATQQEEEQRLAFELLVCHGVLGLPAMRHGYGRHPLGGN